MRLFYTGGTKSGQAQQIPDKSLGGYVSTVQVVSGVENAVFSELTQFALQERERETVMLALMNTLSETVEQIALTFNLPDDDRVSFKYAVVAPTYDASCNEYYFESLQSTKALPVGSQLEVIESATKYTLEYTLAPGEMIGIWLSREIADTALDSLSCSAIKELVEADEYPLAQDGELTVQIDYEEVASLSQSQSQSV